MKYLSPEQMAKPRKRRLRKKLRLAEFQEFGFSFELTYAPASIELDGALDQLIDFVESHGWDCFGGGSPEQPEATGFICKSAVGSLHEADRETAQRWLQAQSWCTGFEIGPLSDCWHNLRE